jgi:hypothetical protein
MKELAAGIRYQWFSSGSLTPKELRNQPILKLQWRATHTILRLYGSRHLPKQGFQLMEKYSPEYMYGFECICVVSSVSISLVLID